MDANLLKLLGDIGAIGILFYLLQQLLSAYTDAFTRVADMLEDEKQDEGDK